MVNQVSEFINASFVAVCVTFALVFIALPVPNNNKLKKYRISLRFLAGAYFAMAVLKILVMAFNLEMVDFISNERLTISSLQATLFAITLITLLNPRFDIRKYLYKQISPIIVLNFLSLLISVKWGNPVIRNFNELGQSFFHPAILIRIVFAFFYLGQLVFLTYLFSRQARSFENEIDNFFTDSAHLYLPWVRYCYYGVLSVGITAFLSCFFTDEWWVLLFTGASTIFYLVFGLYYIQYPHTFAYIEPAIYPSVIVQEKSGKSTRLDWKVLKDQVLAEKYFLNVGVNIEDMAKHLKIGRTTLSIFINTEEGMNFNTWINSLRIAEAQKLLLEYPNHHLSAISEMLGYSEPSNFSRQFKLIANESPSVWRQNHL